MQPSSDFTSPGCTALLNCLGARSLSVQGKTATCPKQNKTDVLLFCLCRASVLGNNPHLHFCLAWVHSPPVVMLPGKLPFCSHTSLLAIRESSDLSCCRRDCQTATGSTVGAQPQHTQLQQTPCQILLQLLSGFSNLCT